MRPSKNYLHYIGFIIIVTFCYDILKINMVRLEHLEIFYLNLFYINITFKIYILLILLFKFLIKKRIKLR